MAEVFISYARADQGFARDLNNALQKLNRDTWIDWRSIPDSAEWRAEIFAAVEAAENFLFIISPDSLRPESFCGPEVAHALANKKRIITILYHPVDRNQLYSGLGEIQWINYPELGFEETFGRLITAIDTDREWLRQYTLLKDKARGWNSKGRDESFLLRGMELQEAVAWLAKAAVVKEPRLLPLQEDYIRASQEHEAREVARLERIAEKETGLRKQAEELAEKQVREAKKLRQRALALGGALLLVLVAFATAFYQSQVARAQARVANSGRLATAALLMGNNHLDLASLLSIEAFRLSRTFDARNALLTLFQTEPRLLSHLSHSAPVQTLAFSRDGRYLATASNDRRIYLWNVATRRLVGKPIPLQTEVDTVAVNSDGSSLAFPEGNLIHLWDVARNQPKGKPLKGHKTAVRRLLFSPDDRVLASADEHGTIGVWDLTLQPVKGHSLNDYFSNTGRPLYFQGDQHPPPVISMAFTSSGEELLCAYNDGATVRWDLTRKPARGTIEKLDNDKGVLLDVLAKNQVRKGRPTVVRGAFGSDATILAAATELAGTTLWDVEGHVLTGSNLMLWDTRHWMLLGTLGDNCCNVFTFSSDNKMLASVTYNLYVQPLELWDVESRQKSGEPLVGHNGSIKALAFSSKGVLASAGDDGKVILWDPSGQQPESEVLKGHTKTVESVVFSPDGKTLASGGDDNTIRLWDFASRKQLPSPLMKHNGPVYGVAFSPDGKMLASASGDHTIRIWDVTTRTPIGEPLTGHTDVVYSVAFNSSGAVLASGSADHTIRFWDVATRTRLGPPLRGHTDGVSSVTFSPDGTLLASASYDHTIRLWDAKNRKPVGEPLRRHSAEIYRLAFSPDGKTLASASGDQTIRLWDVATRRVLRTLEAGDDTSAKLGVAFSSDGSSLVSGSFGGAVQLWNTATGQEIGAPLFAESGHGVQADLAVAFSKDDNTVVAGEQDGAIRLRSIKPELMIARACSRANRNLTIEEWAQYMGANARYHLTCPAVPGPSGR